MAPWRTAIVAVMACVASACGPSASPAPNSGAPTGTFGSATPAASADASPTTAPASFSGPTYLNPIYSRDFPDPHVLLVDGTYYAFSTNAGTTNVPVITSPDLVHWERAGDAMPALPSWAMPNFGNTWAPGVIQIGEKFVLYFVARDADEDLQCIGVAIADAPDGPYLDDSDQPFICQADLGGSIDAYPFADEDGQLYVYWKNDGNCCGKSVGLWGQMLSDDGLTLTGEAVELIQRDQPWEIPLIENPAMVRHEDSHYLFYSGNWWSGPDYAVGYAVCETALGPCDKPIREPLFSYTSTATGPGGQAFFIDADGDLVMAYHAWTGSQVGYPNGMRSLRIEPVAFENGAPVIEGPTTDRQPLP